MPPAGPGTAAWLPPTVPVYAPDTAPAPRTGSEAGVDASGNPETAEDSDLIEKEWVNKAKEIVRQYRTDPYKQTRELHRLRADYMQKRYGKQLEIVD